MYEHNALGYWSGLALCLTKVRSSRARCPATALIFTALFLFMPPTLKKLEGHIAFGLSVCLCVCASVCVLTFEW